MTETLTAPSVSAENDESNLDKRDYSDQDAVDLENERLRLLIEKVNQQNEEMAVRQYDDLCKSPEGQEIERKYSELAEKVLGMSLEAKAKEIYESQYREGRARTTRSPFNDPPEGFFGRDMVRAQEMVQLAIETNPESSTYSKSLVGHMKLRQSFQTEALGTLKR